VSSLASVAATAAASWIIARNDASEYEDGTSRNDDTITAAVSIIEWI